MAELARGYIDDFAAAHNKASTIAEPASNLFTDRTEARAPFVVFRHGRRSRIEVEAVFRALRYHGKPGTRGILAAFGGRASQLRGLAERGARLRMQRAEIKPQESQPSTTPR
jgi:hypothetical protein